MSVFFSIVIPTFNRSTFLPSAFESIRSQTYQDFEIIVVNDGSTDNTEEIVSKHQKIDPRIKLINQENAERGAARNKGWKAAAGKYVVFFDSDDLMKADYLLELEASAKKTDAELICGKIVFQTNQGHHKAHLDQKKLSGFYTYRLFLKGNPCACHFAIKNDWQSFKPFSEIRELSTMEDWIFLLENTVNKKIFIIDKPLVVMRQHEAQSMSQNHTIIGRKQLAVDVIAKNLRLTKKESDILHGYAFENMAIHAVNLGDSKKALNFFWKALVLKGPSMKMTYNAMRMAIRL